MNHSEEFNHSSLALVSPDEWRDRFLRSLLIGAAAFGLLALIPAVFSTPSQTLILIYAASYLSLLATIFFPFPYQIRAGVFLFLLFGLGVSGLSETGIYGDCRVFFLTFVAVATLLVSYRAGIISIAVSILAMFTAAAMILGGLYQPIDPTVSAGALDDWASAITTQLLLSVVIVAGLHRLRGGFIEASENLTQVLQTLREERTTLEQRVAERTKEFEKKADQLNAAAYIAQQAAEIKDLNTLLPNVVRLISEEFGFYHAGIFLISEDGGFAVLQAASSEGGNRMLERGHRLRVGAEGIVGYVASEKRPRIALDVGRDGVYFNNPELPDTRSEIAMPLIARGKLIGILDVQSTEPQAFQQSDLDILQTLADQIGIAIENVQLLTESQRLLKEMEFYSKESAQLNWKTQLSSDQLGFHYTQTGISPLIGKTPTGNDSNALVVPITFRGLEIGKITLQRKPSFPAWTLHEQQMANEIAAQTALALENTRLIEQTRERASREQAIAEISNRIRETLDVETILRLSARELQRTFNLQEAEIRLHTIQGNDLDGQHSFGIEQDQPTGESKK